ncbi:hypothetical protein JDV09_19840 [Mycobacterium sp. Y57]|nr:hypothetical protein [Mycolicibacterium xanthum]MBX7434331.1 hypothetical protein [Mycolicibacterium xanthum]
MTGPEPRCVPETTTGPETLEAIQKLLDELPYRRDTEGNHWTLVRRVEE